MTKTLVLPTLAAGLLLACAPLPARVVPPVPGVVLDAQTGQAVPGARVHVRHEGRYDEVLPERRVLGKGVVSVSAEGYRCSPPRVLEPRRPVRIALWRPSTQRTGRSPARRRSPGWHPPPPARERLPPAPGPSTTCCPGERAAPDAADRNDQLALRVQVTAAGAATSVSPAPATGGWEPL